MINRIMPKSTIIRRNSFIRKNLQKVSELKDLNTRLIRNENLTHDMVIPDGMSAKESFVYKLTGKFPKSVTDRWYETHDYNVYKHLSGNDEAVKVTTQELHEYGYVTENGGTYGGVDSDDNEGLISKIIEHFIDN